MTGVRTLRIAGGSHYRTASFHSNPLINTGA